MNDSTEKNDQNDLTEDQKKIAFKVIEAAKKHGVNPEFALAVAFAESRFDPNAKSPKGALGPMQLMPDTAKGLGVDPTDVDENIDGGVRHLKAISSNPKIGKDPLRVLAAYNAGETRAGEFLDKDDLKLMPEETVGYIARIANLSGGNLPEVFAGQAPEDQEPKPAPSQEIPVTESRPKKGKELLPYAAVGAVGGTGLAGALETTKQIIPLWENISNQIRERQFNPTAPRTRSGLTNYMRSQLPPELQGMTLKQMEQATGQATGRPKIRTMSEVQDALAHVKGAPESTVQKPKVKWVAPNVYEKTNQFRVSQTPAKPPIDLTEFETKQGIRNAIRRQAAKTAEGATRFLPSMARVGLGAVGPALALPEGYNAIENYRREGLSWPVVRQGMSAIGGGLMAFPFPVTEAAGALMMAPQMAADVGLYDALEQSSQEQGKKMSEAMQSPEAAQYYYLTRGPLD